MARLERSFVTIATANGKKSVEALIDPDISGLALTKTPTMRGAVVYTITHVRSGMDLVNRTVSRNVAVKVLRFLGEAAQKQGFSWDVSRTKLMKLHKRAALQAVREAQDLVRELMPARVLARELDEMEAGWVDGEVNKEGSRS